MRAAEQDRPDVARARRWREGMPGPDPERLVFVDETGASTNMARRYGRGPGGVRPVMPRPHGHWKATTFVAALRGDGLTAPTVIDGAVDGAVFGAYVRQQSVPTLRPGDVVVMDNLACHKRAGAREAIEAAGARLASLPAYNPDFDPIEMEFSELKALLREAGERTVEGLWRRLGRSLDESSPQECRNFLSHRGYRATPTGKSL